MTDGITAMYLAGRDDQRTVDEGLLKMCRDAIEQGEPFEFFDNVLLPVLNDRLGESE